jgi:hypothetical protein
VSHLVPSPHPLSVHRNDQIAGLEPRLLSGRLRCNLRDQRNPYTPFVSDAGEDHEGEYHVHRHAGADHQGTCPDGLSIEVARRGRTLRIRATFERSCRLLIGHPFHLHVAAEGNGRDDILCLAPPKPEQLRTEADREPRHLYIHGLGCPEMAQLVNEYQDSQHDDCCEYRDCHTLFVRPLESGCRLYHPQPKTVFRCLTRITRRSCPVSDRGQPCPLV